MKEASQAIERTLATLGFSAQTSEFGRHPRHTAFHCRLLSEDNRMPPEGEGLGKGTATEARVGAVFEAVEHCFGGPYGFGARVGRPVAAGVVGSGTAVDRDVAIGLLRAQPDVAVPCVEYVGLNTASVVDVPLGLVEPWYVEDEAEELRRELDDRFDYVDLMRYSTNSGSAIGIGRDEALLHGLNEILERDAFSLMLVRTFVRRSRTRPATVADDATIPAVVCSVMQEAAELRCAPVRLLDLGRDFGVTTMLAYCEPTASLAHRRGVGSSVDPFYAAWRAVTELLQNLLCSPADEDPSTLDALGGHPTLFEAAHMDLRQILPRLERTPFPSPLSPDPGPPSSQLRTLLRALGQRGVPVYAHDLAVLPEGVNLVHVFAPDLERFMLAVGGCLVVPGRRAMQSP